jgi:hypothetical protein
MKLRSMKKALNKNELKEGRKSQYRKPQTTSSFYNDMYEEPSCEDRIQCSVERSVL